MANTNIGMIRWLTGLWTQNAKQEIRSQGPIISNSWPAVKSVYYPAPGRMNTSRVCVLGKIIRSIRPTRGFEWSTIQWDPSIDGHWINSPNTSLSQMVRMEWGVAWNTLAHGIIGIRYMMLQGQAWVQGLDFSLRVHASLSVFQPWFRLCLFSIAREPPMDAWEI